MNSIKLFATALTVSSFMFVSCDDGSKKASDIKEDISEKIETTIDNMEKEGEEVMEEVKTRTYKMKDGTSIAYDIDSKGIVGFDDWNDYTIVNYELADMRKSKNFTIAERINNMNYRIANLGNTIPAWLKTEEVMEDVADVQKEYKELIDDKDASEEEMKENLEEVSEKFDDLKEELDETVKEYTKIHKEAIEEFNEEIKKGKINAAIEEYNEEIKKLDKMIEKK
ncbi:hypothetical protein H9I45_12545 [Polaribacter haliotis]|uniref:Uncharacterized protein n=1 Tax=Polaribacter haliotis TaxID=1888915 RepID=A0A7L8AE08_9FLAO|nr:hypothetical protein [Polaribacter haliotis]QOD60164.1 hypothetical protein H9I45_12545 [Polaribacter haliotis]